MLRTGDGFVKASLYDAAGVKVIETAGSAMNLSGIRKGFYVLICTRADGSVVSVKIAV